MNGNQTLSVEDSEQVNDTQSRLGESELYSVADQSASAPPKPPPRTTSIYHLQQLQQQTFQNATVSDLADLMEHQAFLSNSSLSHCTKASNSYSNTSTEAADTSTDATAKDVPFLRREKMKENKSFKPRPKSDIYDAINEHQQQDISSEAYARPLSMYGDSDTKANKHSISRFSAYDLSV